jgi:type VI secretion system secreted protein VgrG
MQFLENDINRPLIVGALYNGHSEGGTLPTPCGKSEQDSDTAIFGAANDHAVAAQGNLAGGNGPLHRATTAAASAVHRNSAAQ